MPDLRAKSILVIGHGNTLRGDDAVGCLIAEEVERWQCPGVRVLSVPQLTPELAADLAAAAIVVFVDARTYPPGTALPSDVDVERLLPDGHESAALIHAITPGVLLGLCQALFHHVPSSWQIAVPGSDFAFGEVLSGLADRGMKQALGKIESLLGREGCFEPGGPSACPAWRSHQATLALQEFDHEHAHIIQVDSFTNRPFAGNPAAVCLLDAPAPESWMQHVALEMNLSETAFVHPIEPGSLFRLRWFTPRVEVDLCGHATLAAAHVLWEEKILRPQTPAQFETRSGRLIASRQGEWIELDFPSEPINTPINDPRELDRITTALGAGPISAGRNRFDLLVEFADEQTVRNLQPNYRLVFEFPVRGIIATSRSSEPGFDFVSRFFAPRVGVDEDPVCGSAHCCLGPFWASKLGRNELVGHQVSPRGGVVKVRVDGARVALIGQAVTVLRGELLG